MVSRKSFALVSISIIALTLSSVGPVAAQDEVCVGGGPAYWLDRSNPWPSFLVPKKFQQPKVARTSVTKRTQFDTVFRYRKGRDSEGPIFPRMTLRKVLARQGTGLTALGRHTVAALLNAAARSQNQFTLSPAEIIYNFQVYWDGTEDMRPKKSRAYIRRIYARENANVCPAPVVPPVEEQAGR
jgi:hypothetical protein